MSEVRPGPFRALTGQEAAHVGTTAEGAAGRVERALGIAAQTRTLAQRCACGGEIDMHGGEGQG
ncbi:hypothetical protein [Streptomyces sp. NPDC048641]|uniref:hypothetical protein n=1 Tax=Streptomyces sp. NPDC048641 TaxID=3154825 RepID=UPI003444DB23